MARTIATLILDFMKFVVSEIDFPDLFARFLQGFVVPMYIGLHSIT